MVHEKTPIRIVAEEIAMGKRSYLQLALFTPGITVSQATKAISEMLKKGPLVSLEHGLQLIPTKAFNPWLAGLRLKEDEPKAQLSPQQPGNTSCGSPSPTAAVLKPYYRRLSTDRRQGGLEMAARIKDHLRRRNKNTISLSELKRALHADRHPDAFADGVSQLVRYGMAKVRDGRLTLTAAEGIALPDPYRQPAEPKRKRKRRPSEWFEKNRSKMDNGQHSDFGEDGEEDEDSDDGDEDSACRQWESC